MHKIQTIVTCDRRVCLSRMHQMTPAWLNGVGCGGLHHVLSAWGRSVQPSTNAFGLLFAFTVSLIIG